MGPLYPLTVSALLAVTGSTYYVMKLAAVWWSLVGLAALFVLCRRLAGTALATLATVVAGTGSWLLVYSRLGDVEAAVPFLAMASLALAARIVETRPTSVLPAVLCGLVTGASLYCYGAAFAIPLLVTATLAGMYLFMPRPRFAARHLIVYAVTLVLSFAPMVASFRSMEDVTGGHFGSRLVRADVAGTLLRNLGTALSVYVIEGDPVSRGNPRSLPHVDPIGLALAIAGAVWWLLPSRRRWGVVLDRRVPAHAPSDRARDRGRDVNAARTIGAAPFLYILVASGLLAVYRLVRPRGGTPRRSRHRRRVARGHGRHQPPSLLPALSRRSSLRQHRGRECDRGVHRHAGRRNRGAPGRIHLDRTACPSPRASTTSYAAVPKAFSEDRAGTWTASAWPRSRVRRSSSGRPTTRSRARCSPTAPRGSTPQLYSSTTGLPLFNAASLHAGRTDSAALPSLSTPSPGVERAPIVLGGRQIEIRYQAIDMGQPSAIVDGDLQTLMRGADHTPYRFELHWEEPTRLAGFRMWLGYVPEFQMDVIVRDAAGRETRFMRRDQPDTAQPLLDLQLPGGAIDAVSAAFTFTDFRDHPVEGWHFHLFELEPY